MNDIEIAKLKEFSKRLSDLEVEIEAFASAFKDNDHRIWRVWQPLSTASAVLKNYVTEVSVWLNDV